MTERILDSYLDAGRNFRELGGYQTKDGKIIKSHKLLRSANLATLTEKDKTFLYNYGLRKDMDFRSKVEAKNEPDRVPDGVEYIFNPVFERDETKSTILKDSEKDFGFSFDDGYNQMVKSYEDMILSPKSRNAYRLFFNHLLENTKDNEAVLFHCTAGKDRTGMGAVYLLWALGVDTQTIRADYLLTNSVIKDFVNSKLETLREKQMSDPEIQSVRALMTVNQDYINKAKDVILKEAGSMDNYLNENIGLSNNEIKDLKKIYLI